MEEDQVGELPVDPEEPFGKRILPVRADDAPRDGRDGVSQQVDDPVPGAQRSRIDA